MMKREPISEKKQRILIVDDSDMNREILQDMLSDAYDVAEASDGLEAVNYMRSHLDDLSLVFLDIVMPRMDGLSVLDLMNKFKWIQSVPVIIISSDGSAEKMDRAYELGASDFIRRPFDVSDVRRRAVNTMKAYDRQKKLSALVEEQVYAREKEQSLMINILSYLVEFRNGDSGYHAMNIRTVTDLLLRSLVQISDRYELSTEEISLISTASDLHDVGKILIPDGLLEKESFTEEERKTIKTHAAKGADIIRNLPNYQSEPLLRVAYEICRWHHERYDGSGYPDGLKGDKIPISAQAVGLADVYDTFTSGFEGKEPLPHEQVVQMIMTGECGAFNPLLLRAFSRISDTLPKELRLGAVSRLKEWSMEKLMREVVNGNLLYVTSYTADMIRHEREKLEFFAENSREILFEIYLEPFTLCFRGKHVEKYGLSEIIYLPTEDEKLLSLVPRETVEKMLELVKGMTVENPEAKISFLSTTGKRVNVQLRAQFEDGEDALPEFALAVGEAEIEESAEEKNVDRGVTL